MRNWYTILQNPVLFHGSSPDHRSTPSGVLMAHDRVVCLGVRSYVVSVLHVPVRYTVCSKMERLVIYCPVTVRKVSCTYIHIHVQLSNERADRPSQRSQV